MFALAGPGRREREEELLSRPQQMWGGVGGARQKGTLPGDGGGMGEQVKPTVCSLRGGDGPCRWAEHTGTPGGVGESSAPSMPLPGSLSHKRGPGARRAAGSTSPLGRGQGRATRLPASPPPPAGPAWLRGLWREGVGTASFSSREGAGGQKELETAGSRPLAQKGELRPRGGLAGSQPVIH